MLSRLAGAQLPSPRLDTAFPPGARAGTEVEVTLTGSDLPDASALLFETPGLTATKIEALKFRVAVAADCAPGLHELRAMGRYGISTPLPFVVGDVPEIVDPGSNHTRETAAAISIPQVVQGRAEAEQRDFYKFSAKKDQAVHVACSAFALDSPMDPVVVVVDAKGATFARGDDELDRDAMLTFVAPTDGDYFVVVHDKLFAGGPAHAYRLTVAAEASCVVPLLPSAGAVDYIVGQTPVSELEPNDTAATAQPIELPCEVRGAFDCDWFTCRAEANRPLWLEIVADRDGNSSDPLLLVYKVIRDAQSREQTKQVLELDDQPELPSPPHWQVESRDPAGRFVPDESATYQFRVTDRFGRHGNYRFILREAAQPDFALLALGESPANEEKKIFKWQPNLRRGGSAYFPVAVLRRGYDGEIILRAEGLPETVTASGVIAAGAATGIFALQATTEAKPWAGYVRVVGEAGGVTREIRCVNYRWNVDNRDNQRLASGLVHCAVGIADEAAPIGIAASESKTWEANIGTDLEIPLQFARPNPDAQPKGEWQIISVNLPGLKKFEPLKFDGASAKDAKLVLHLQKEGNDLKAGTYAMLLRARGTVGYKADAKAASRDLKDVEFSAPIAVKLMEPVVAPPPAAAK
jgi:hypothetical protein